MDFKKGALHHAYVFLGFDAIEVLRAFANACDVPIEGNPDIVHVVYDTCGIDEVRALQSELRTKAFSQHRIALCEAQGLLYEAQHALLKLLEEPTAHTHILFVLPRAQMILDTVRSRVVLLKKPQTEERAGSFAHKTPGEKLKNIEQLLKKEDPALIEVFLRDVEYFCKDDTVRARRIVPHLFEVRRALSMRGTSKKQLLESVALLIS